jgi:hypothetical protein
MFFKKSKKEKKVSEMLMDCASDFIMLGENEFDKQQRLYTAASAWNFACVNKENRKRQIQKYLKNFQKMNPGCTEEDVKNVKDILNNIISEKIRLYPDVKIQLFDAEVKDQGGKTYVKAASKKM